MAKKGGSKEDKPAYSGDGKKGKSGYSAEELEEMNRNYAREIKQIKHVNDLEKAKCERELKKYVDREAKQEQEIAELKLRISQTENVNTEEELRQKVEELNNIKDAYSKKMKNTVALQRLKYEKLIEKIKRDLDAYHRVMNAAEKESGPKEEIADYDKLAPEEKLSKLTEFADELYLHRAGMLYKQWHADMAGKMSLTGVIGLTSVSLDRFDEKVKAHIGNLRASEADFRAGMNSGYPDAALDAYFSDAMITRMKDVAIDAQIENAGVLRISDTMVLTKGRLEGEDAFTIRNAFIYEVDMLADEIRKKKQPAP